MSRSDFHDRLLDRLRAAGRKAAALGIDLGTTKSCVAYADFDPVSGELHCECVKFPQHDGVAVPSAVAIDSGRPIFGADALAKRGQRGFLPERGLFYETKNEIGLRYTYARAPAGFSNAADIAARLIGHLRDSITDSVARRADAPLVIGVPASFHAAQRMATVEAGERGFWQPPGAGKVRLLDEPYAAFLDLLLRAPDRAAPLLQPGRTLLVFDFGGGTCDVAIFRLEAKSGETFGARLLGTSRYHRLGGGDIDRAIVHDVLIPALLEENGLKSWDVSWNEKRRHLEPALLATAERLKIDLSRALGGDAAIPGDLQVMAGSLTVEARIGGVVRTLVLTSPTLDADTFNDVLAPFLDALATPEAGSEYVQRGSIFSPIVQAMDLAGMETDDIDGILLCGSSSLLPPVQQALAKEFPNATSALLGEAEDLQGAVARGAALQALALQLLGEPLIAPVCSSELSLQVTTGQVPLIRAGDAVPAASAAPVELRPPHASPRDGIDLAVEIVADGKRVVGRKLWHLPAPVSADDLLALEWRIDENQCVELTLHRQDDADTSSFVHRFDAPITHRDMGQLVRCQMLERMQSIREDKVPRADLGNAFEQIAKDCGALGEYEKGIHFVRLAVQEKGDTLNLLNMAGIYREKIGDTDGAQASYERAASDWTAPRFNLARLHFHAGRHAEALHTVDAAIAEHDKRAYHCLRGDILAALGRQNEARLVWEDAIGGHVDFATLDDFELGWVESAASKLKRDETLDRIRSERQARAQQVKRVTRQGELPVFVGQALRDPAEEV